jgi:hypothetical protein
MEAVDVARGEIAYALRPWLVLRGHLRGHDGGARRHGLGLGHPGAARGDADQLRVRVGRDGGDHLHARLDRLRLRPAGAPAACSCSRPPSTPLATYPRWLQIVVECTPLFHGVSLVRALTLGDVGPAAAGHAVYLAPWVWRALRRQPADPNPAAQLAPRISSGRALCVDEGFYELSRVELDQIFGSLAQADKFDRNT